MQEDLGVERSGAGGCGGVVSLPELVCVGATVEASREQYFMLEVKVDPWMVRVGGEDGERGPHGNPDSGLGTQGTRGGGCSQRNFPFCSDPQPISASDLCSETFNNQNPPSQTTHPAPTRPPPTTTTLPPP